MSLKNSYSQIIQTLASMNSFGFTLTIVCLLYLGVSSEAGPLILFNNQKSRFREVKQPAHCNPVITSGHENVALLPLWSFSLSLLSFIGKAHWGLFRRTESEGPESGGSNSFPQEPDTRQKWVQRVACGPLAATSSEWSRKTRDQDFNV